jgi:hypothetical protein
MASLPRTRKSRTFSAASASAGDAMLAMRCSRCFPGYYYEYKLLVSYSSLASQEANSLRLRINPVYINMLCSYTTLADTQRTSLGNRDISTTHRLDTDTGLHEPNPPARWLSSFKGGDDSAHQLPVRTLQAPHQSPSFPAIGPPLPFHKPTIATRCRALRGCWTAAGILAGSG